MRHKPSSLNTLPHHHLLPVRQLAALLRCPPDIPLVYHAYNQLRQVYILEQVTRHFKTRPDDPAPLYGKKLLDVGCGESTVAQFLALSGAEITAIDPDPEALAKAEAGAAEFGAPIEFLPLKAEQLLLNKNEKYDVILALDLMEAVDDSEKVLWVLTQLLAPGGLLILSAIKRSAWAWFIHIFLSNYVYRRNPRKLRRHLLGFRTIAAQAKRHGLQVEHVQRLRFNPATHQWTLAENSGTRYLTALGHI